MKMLARSVTPLFRDWGREWARYGRGGLVRQRPARLQAFPRLLYKVGDIEWLRYPAVLKLRGR